MNWIFEAYSNVYTTAMMSDLKNPAPAAIAKKPGLVARFQARLLK